MAIGHSGDEETGHSGADETGQAVSWACDRGRCDVTPLLYG